MRLLSSPCYLWVKVSHMMSTSYHTTPLKWSLHFSLSQTCSQGTSVLRDVQNNKSFSSIFSPLNLTRNRFWFLETMWSSTPIHSVLSTRAKLWSNVKSSQLQDQQVDEKRYFLKFHNKNWRDLYSSKNYESLTGAWDEYIVVTTASSKQLIIPQKKKVWERDLPATGYLTK